MKKINWLDHFVNLIAVIIGVTLAFFINSYTESNNAKREKDRLLSTIRDQIATDIRVLEEGKIRFGKLQLQALDQLLRHYEGGENPLPDSIDNARVLTVDNYAPQPITYEELKSSGGFSYISNQELRRALEVFYEAYSKEAEIRGSYQAEYFQDPMLAWSIKNTKLAEFSLNSIQDREFHNMVYVYRGLVDNKLKIYQDLVEKGSEIVELLDKELE